MYGWQCQEPQQLGVETGHKHCTNNPIPTSFFHAQCHFPVISEHNQRSMSRTKKVVGMGLFVQCFYALSLHLVSVVFGTAIPTSLYIVGKCFIYLYNIYLCHLNTLHQSPPGTLYCIKAQLAGIYLSARPLTRESYDRYTLLRKPVTVARKGDTNYINHAKYGAYGR